MADPKLPQLVAVRCPTCAGSTNAAELVKVPAELRYEVISFKDRKPGDRLYLCDKCPGCGAVWCVKHQAA